jgi:hypothetical protein
VIGHRVSIEWDWSGLPFCCFFEKATLILFPFRTCYSLCCCCPLGILSCYYARQAIVLLDVFPVVDLSACLTVFLCPSLEALEHREAGELMQAYQESNKALVGDA